MTIDGFRTPRATCLLAPNPSPMTLDGTNTWVIAEPGSPSVVVVDPGPEDEGHLRRVLAERRVITPLMPTVVVEDERAWLAMPQAVEYPL